MSRRKKLLIVGGKSYQNTKVPRIGGTTVLMDNYLEYCMDHDVPHVFVSTNRYTGALAGIRNSIAMLAGILYNAPRCGIIMVNISSKAGIHKLLPLALRVGRIFGMKVACRQFAGSIHKYLDSNPDIKTRVIKWLKETKVSFFETKELVEYFKDNGVEVQWFPNVRKPTPFSVDKIFTKKFVFISQVKPEKGVDQLIEAAKSLPEGYTIDIYGPIAEKKYSAATFQECRNISYKGVLGSNEVIKTLVQYNVLLLPTYWEAEGYPGIIIEAMSVGMPVITTPTGGITELVENGTNGMLIPQKDADALKDAIMSYDQQRYSDHVAGANTMYGEHYNSDTINARITDLMLS